MKRLGIHDVVSLVRYAIRVGLNTLHALASSYPADPFLQKPFSPLAAWDTTFVTPSLLLAVPPVPLPRAACYVDIVCAQRGSARLSLSVACSMSARFDSCG